MPYWIAVLCGVGLLSPPLVILRRRRWIHRWAAAAKVGLWYGLGFVTIVSLLNLPRLFHDLYDPDVMWLYGGMIAAVLWSTLIAAASWLLLRRFGTAYVPQDGALCPACGYCLIGNVSMTCPECGRSFTLTELGTTEAEFHRRAAR